MNPLRLATRGSRLALVQSALVVKALRAKQSNLDIDLVQVQTEGDIDRTTPLNILGGRGVFVREVERVLLRGEAEIAVHSLKDLPTAALHGLTLAAVLTRADPRDVLVSSNRRRLAELPADARVGTSSPRRALLLRTLRPDLQISEIRGNVDTRLRKVADGEYDAVVLAAAGLDRINRIDEATQFFEALEFLPSPGQGALAVQCRSDDMSTLALLADLDDPDTHAAVDAERGILAELGSGCTLPVGAFAQPMGGLLALRGMIGDESGSRASFGDAAGPIEEAEALGRGLARELMASTTRTSSE